MAIYKNIHSLCLLCQYFIDKWPHKTYKTLLLIIYEGNLVQILSALYHQLRPKFLQAAHKTPTELLNEYGQLHRINFGVVINFKMTDEENRRSYDDIARELVTAYQTYDIDGLANFGIEVTNNGHLVFDEKTFARLHAATYTYALKQ